MMASLPVNNQPLEAVEFIRLREWLEENHSFVHPSIQFVKGGFTGDLIQINKMNYIFLLS
jgi:hypothetical protein